MKSKILNILLILVLFNGCAPATYITGSWKSPAAPQKQYKSILVAALTNNVIAKSTLENEIAGALGKNIRILKSIEEFPPGINGTDSSKAVIMSKVKDKNVDAILTISIISKETESRYVPGARPYEPLGYIYYNDFWGYYSYWSPRFYDQGYYEQNKVYFIETNLYDIETEKLLWSAQSKTYSPDDLQPFAKEFANVIVAKLRSDKIIPDEPKKGTPSPEGY
jgi:hypothetical protein